MDNQEISIKFSNKVDGEKALQQYEERLKSIYSCVVGIEKGQKVFDTTKSNAKELANTTDKTTKSVEKMAGQFNLAFNLKSMSVYLRTTTNFFKQLTSMTQKSVNYVENINLLEVAYHNANETIEESSARIEDFIDKMSEVYGLDESNLARKLGIFKQLANAMQLPTQEAERLSELMVKMTNDIASLYNLDLNRASNALQSALAGQVRPIRSATGADITEKTLQNTVDALGLDRSISELSFVEKRLIMVISLTNQLKNSQGDYARTIESASNQIRIMKEQFERLGRSVGNVLYPILQGIMPYINGLLMALTEIFNLIATLLGFEMPEFDYSGLAGASDYVMDLEDGLAGAGENADKLNNKLKGLRGFDKLNVINTPTNGGGSSGGAGGGIDPTIMDAFNKAFGEYDDKLDSVRMKAVEIRNNIMEWLGFTKKINPLTGEIEWEYQGIGKTFENLYNSFKKLSPLVKTIIAYITGKTLINALKNIVKYIGNSGIYKFIKLLLSPLKEIIEYIKLYKSITGNGIDGFLGGLDSWKAHATAGERLATALKGMTINAIGLYSIKTSMDDINNSGLNLLNTLGLVGGELSTVLGGAMIGASIGGGTGALIGGIAGAIEGLIVAIINYKSETDKLIEQSEKEAEKARDVKKAYDERKQAIQDEMDSSLAVSTYHERLLGELKGLTDENGNLKKGYEDRAEYILGTLNKAYGTEYSLLDLQQGKYEEIADAIRKVIEAKRAEIILNANEKAYTEALEKRTQAWYDYNSAIKKWNDLNEQGNVILDKINEMEELRGTNAYRNYEYTSLLTGETYRGHYAYLQLQDDLKANSEMMDNQQDALNDLRDVWQGYNEDVIFYEDLQTAILTENVDEQNRLIDEHLNKITTANGDEKMSLADQLAYLKSSKEETKRIYEENGKEITEGQKAQWEEQEKNLAEALLNQTLCVTKITPEQAKAWAELGKTNEKEFMDKFSQLPDNLRKQVIDKMREKGYDISKELQTGINQMTPEVEIKVNANTSTLFEKLANVQNQIKSMFNKADGGIFVNGSWQPVSTYASGGLPPVGQMFVARERGPELVGTIGGHTAVMNNDQIVGSVSNGVYQAVRSAMGSQNQGTQVFNIYLDEEHKIGTYTLDQLQSMAKSNGKAITLG